MLWSFPHRLGDGRGEDSNVELFPSQFSLSVYSSLQISVSPPPLSESLFLQIWTGGGGKVESAKKRQACGPLTTSCSLFCDTKTVPRSVLRAALSLVRHSRRRNPVFQVWNAPVKSLSKGTEMLIVYSCVNFCRSHATARKPSVAFNMALTGSVISLLSMPQIYKSTGVWRLTGSGFKIQLKREAVLSSAILRKKTQLALAQQQLNK